MNKQNVIYTKCPSKRRHRERERRPCTEADTASYAAQAKEHLEPPETEEARKDFPLEALRKHSLPNILTWISGMQN